MNMLYTLLFIIAGALGIFFLFSKLLVGNNRIFKTSKKRKKQDTYQIFQKPPVKIVSNLENKDAFSTPKEEEKPQNFNVQDELLSEDQDIEFDLASCKKNDKEVLKKKGIKFFDK